MATVFIPAPLYELYLTQGEKHTVDVSRYVLILHNTLVPASSEVIMLVVYLSYFVALNH